MKHKFCYWAPGYTPPPPPFIIETDHKQYIRLNTLTQKEKKQLGQGILKHEPGLAKIMQSQEMRNIKKMFGAVQVMDRKKYNNFTKVN